MAFTDRIGLVIVLHPFTEGKNSNHLQCDLFFFVLQCFLESVFAI